MNLPVIISEYTNVDTAVTDLVDAVSSSYSQNPNMEEIKVWEHLDRDFINSGINYPIMAEFPMFGLERADFIIVDTQKALVIEAKGWKSIQKIRGTNMVVIADKEHHIDPCYQLQNYVSKMKYFHSSGRNVDYQGILYLYNNNSYTSEECEIIHGLDDLLDRIKGIGPPGKELQINEIIEGKFSINEDLIDMINRSKLSLMANATKTLVSSGYGLTENQAILVNDILKSVENGEDKAFIIRGPSGSGKTLVALQIVIEAVARGWKALLAYRNNRLLNTMRQVLNINNGSVNLSSLVQYYSTGRNIGIGESGFQQDRFGKLDLIVYDEAQRMTESVIQMTQNRSMVKVYFYDDSQILIGDEAGIEANFTRYLNNCEIRSLTSVFRVPENYLKFVKHLLWDDPPTSAINYDINIKKSISDMMADLNTKKKSNKIALICAFTESRGDSKNSKSEQNRRIGYPLPSGLDLYKNSGLDIYWLMNEKTEYPRYWRGELDPLKFCASIYGAQGFEADFTGVVWGRDLVWRNGWHLNSEAITDNIGNNYSLKSLSKSNPSTAMNLLKNRYYTILTRGIKGTDIFFEDEETMDHVMKEIEKCKIT
ncbi:MAG: DNA/RNA helicase domain-containing protein [Thermoplasmata archaeon]